MKPGFRLLAKRLQNELPEIELTLSRAMEGLKRTQKTGDDYYLDGVALNLHGFYSCVERIFELIAAHIDSNVPTGENWHRILLNQMAEEIPDIRPSVISEAVRQDLDEYLGFRHIVRNVYTYKFDSARVEKLVDKVSPLFNQFQAELLAFADFLISCEETE